MSGYRVIPLPQCIADDVRKTMLAPQYGHRAHADVATDHAPCRVCLRVLTPGQDKRLLFTYDPFEAAGTTPLPGPVYIHAEPCEPYAGAGFPPQLRAMSILLDVYGDDRRLVAEVMLGEVADPATIDTAVAEQLDDVQVRYLHVRSATAGCFVAAITR